VSIISARNARNAERAAVASARADSVERARADSISRAAAAAAADSATVQINAGLPLGATVTIDKAPVSGRTVRLSSGSHTFSAIAPGFRIATQTLNVRRGQTLVWPSRLEPEAKRDTVAAQHTVANCADAARRSDWTRALSVCSKEAGSSKGNAFAERTLGTMHERGLGVAQNLPVAGEWYSASASHGDRVAQYLYGRMLQDGRGVKRDEEAAFRLFQTSADQGEVDAQFAAGDALDHGRGVRTNKGEAARWYLKAAEQGHAEAQFALGMLYEKGDGVSKSDADANKWFQKAAAKGNERAKQELARRGVRP
jgi:TPR repeat protein